MKQCPTSPLPVNSRLACDVHCLLQWSVNRPLKWSSHHL